VVDSEVPQWLWWLASGRKWGVGMRVSFLNMLRPVKELRLPWVSLRNADWPTSSTIDRIGSLPHEPCHDL